MSLEKVVLEVFKDKISESDAQEASASLVSYFELLNEIYKTQDELRSGLKEPETVNNSFNHFK